MKKISKIIFLKKTTTNFELYSKLFSIFILFLGQCYKSNKLSYCLPCPWVGLFCCGFALFWTGLFPKFCIPAGNWLKVWGWELVGALPKLKFPKSLKSFFFWLLLESPQLLKFWSDEEKPLPLIWFVGGFWKAGSGCFGAEKPTPCPGRENLKSL